MEIEPQLTWEVGTAYDLFISLDVLHDPDRFGLRGNWAAGVRSRLPVEQREFLQDVMTFHHVWPLPWLISLPEPKDSRTVLERLEEIPAGRRLHEMTNCYMDESFKTLLYRVAEHAAWDETDQQQLVDLYTGMHRKEGKSKKKVSDEEVQATLHVWANAEQFGLNYVEALKSYYEVFFHEEEERILPALAQSAARAQTLAGTIPLDELLNELSQGLRFDYEDVTAVQEVAMIPSFWTTPLSYFGPIGQGHVKWAFLFGGRPNDMSLVPGEVVPELLYNTLKALADPTRLRILKHLSEGPLTPAELARRLRLRPPTVIHHLDALRLARLVHVTLSQQGRRYAARQEAIGATCDLLHQFVSGERDARTD
ncbi:MAG: winged helix-turn-helix domain-containing protein [Anaerolineae bacterium]|nr:winged helix-turn-helix domain-containing protein [Anaerolineae bacterium]